jgi:hypothetical protein
VDAWLRLWAVRGSLRRCESCNARRGLLAFGTAIALASLSACSYTPDAVKGRKPLPSCGEYENKNQPPSPDQLEMNRCILDALADGRQAELVATSHTIEGDPIPRYYRVLGPERVEVFTDSTRDAYAGSGAKWGRLLCRDLRQVAGYLEPVDCRNLPLDET